MKRPLFFNMKRNLPISPRQWHTGPKQQESSKKQGIQRKNNAAIAVLQRGIIRSLKQVITLTNFQCSNYNCLQLLLDRQLPQDH